MSEEATIIEAAIIALENADLPREDKSYSLVGWQRFYEKGEQARRTALGILKSRQSGSDTDG